MGQFSKKWEDLQFSDNFIFCKVMRNKELCKEMLQILLGIKVRDIQYIQSEHPFDYGIPLYTENKVFQELLQIPINDKSHRLFYNCSAFAKAEDEEVRSVLEFIYLLKAQSEFTKKLQDSVIQAKAEPVFKDEYMYFADILEDEVEKAASKKADEDVVGLLKLGTVSHEDISTAIGIPLDHVKELAAQLQSQK